jgi:hypothetical protein
MGKTYKIGGIVIAMISPGLESIGFLNKKEKAQKFIPQLLTYSSEVHAIVRGGFISPEERDELLADVVGKEGL